MTRAFDHVEQAAILEYYQRWAKSDNRGVPKQVEELLAEIPSEGEKPKKEDVAEALHHNFPKKKPALKAVVVEAAFRIITKNRKAVLALPGSPATKQMLRTILADAEDTSTITHILLENWTKHSRTNPDLTATGLFQIFRRYKPIAYSKEDEERASNRGEDRYKWSEASNHVVVCELVYLSMSDRLAYMVDAHGDKHFGTFHIDHNKLLFAVFQRHVDRDIVDHRFCVVQLQSKKEHVLAGLLLKAGDTEFRPVASEAILLRVPEKNYNELHQTFAREVLQADMATKIPEDCLIRKYISDPQPSSKYNPNDPGPEWERVRFVRDFPPLLNLVNIQSTGTSYLREPSRALDISTIHSASGNAEWVVFCQSGPALQIVRKK